MAGAKGIDALVSKLQEESSKLNKNAESVNDLLATFESRLNAASPGIDCWLNVDIEPTDESDVYDERDDTLAFSRHEAYRLGYTRLGEKWGLASRVVEVRSHGTVTTLTWHRPGEPHIPDQPKVVSIVQAPLAVRIRALELLPNLFEALISKARQRNETIERASSILKGTS